MNSNKTLGLSFFYILQVACFTQTHATTQNLNAPQKSYYVGLGIGESTLFETDQYQNSLMFQQFNGTQFQQRFHQDNTATLFEGHVGYQRNIRAHTMLGIKGAILYTPVEMSSQSTAMLSNPAITPSTPSLSASLQNINQISMQPVYNIDGILTYTRFSKLQPFIEAGVSFSNVRNLHRQFNFIQSPLNLETIAINADYNTRGINTGYNVGLGTHYYVQSSWFFSAEVLFHDLGQYRVSKTYSIPALGGNTSSSSQRSFQLLSVLGSLSYAF